MTTLHPGDGTIVLINTFSVAPERAEELLQLLSQATDAEMSRQPGFISANLHISLDRKHVTNYAQWRSKADYDAIFDVPAVTEHMGRANEVADGFDPILYELREVHDEPSPS